MPDVPLAVSTEEYGAADIEPKATPQELRRWWLRDTIGPRFHPYIVKRVREETTCDGLRYFYFQLARREDLGDLVDPTQPKLFMVELTQQFRICWPDLPSTAPRATDKHPYGFLLLSEAWETSANLDLGATLDVRTLREGGKKWPIAASNKMLLRALSEDEALEDLPLLEVLNDIMLSLR
ncbi:hypothetical protein [Myxococcus fulvus]|uniref:hypothetical protein n=1 Tax=Myxococcus fulvus TaxID=33 RepID=UPI0020C083C4|nr:hypothetical protein [Myxococcus fulvus]MCK8501570.1 hypothetical protein [Myxococcus fulvus]